MKKLLLLIGGFLVLGITSCEHEELSTEIQEEHSSKLLSRTEINQKIIEIFKQNGSFEWNQFKDNELWSAFQFSENTLLISYDQSSKNGSQKQQIIDFINSSEGTSKSSEEIVLNELEDLSVMTVKIYKRETLFGLKQMKSVSTVEPFYSMYTEDEVKSLQTKKAKRLSLQKSAQKNSPFVANYNGRTHRANRLLLHHQIPLAWEHGLNGDNITIGLIDDGVHENNPFFGKNGNNDFNNPSGRNHSAKSRFVDSWNPWKLFVTKPYTSPYNRNPKSHGDWLVNELAAPLNNGLQGDVKINGIAYNSDLITLRSSNMVFIDIPPVMLGVARSYEYLADRSEVKIISMSQGGLISWEPIKRAIRKCHDRGKLLFAAGGTFPNIIPGVTPGDITWATGLTIFPANYDRVVSVTGIKKVKAYDGSGNPEMKYCTQCFGKADFVFEFYDGQDDGGSSSFSTAATAGMAALIWAKNPNMNRDQVLQKMRAASDWPHSKDRLFGHGRVQMRTYLENEGYEIRLP